MTQQNVTTADNGLDVSAIHPRNGEKYSHNLYAWLTDRNRPHRAKTSRVYRDTVGALWIGHLDLGDLIGARLYGVLCNGAEEQSAYWDARGLDEASDFWLRYMADGRCAIDQEHNQHFVGDATRWRVDGDTRTCMWCGKVRQTLVRWTETVERERWEVA